MTEIARDCGSEADFAAGWYNERRKGGTKMAVVCPECDNPILIDTDEVEEGETITCDECGTDLEIVSVDPLEIAPVDVEGYDDEDLSHEADEEEDE